MDYFTIYRNLFVYQSIHMTIAWIACCYQNNGSYVDLAWPSGFTIMALQFLYHGEAELSKKLLIVIPYLLCGLRFMKFWIIDRQHHKYEDARWNLWRERWKNGKGTFGIKSVAVNFFFFYQTCHNAPAQIIFNTISTEIWQILLKHGIPSSFMQNIT